MEPRLRKTTNYKVFRLHPVNRDVRKIKALVKSMRRHGFLAAFPLVCYPNGDGSLNVLDGHHRLHVAELLGLPVYYVVDNRVQDVSVYEVTDCICPWTMSDFLASYVKAGIPDYLQVQNKHEQSGISLTRCVSMLGGELAASSNQNTRFKRGVYQVKTTEHFDEVADVVRFSSERGIEWARNSNFVDALSRVLMVPEVKRERIKEQIKKYPQLMDKQRSQDEYVQMIEELYNHARRRDNRVAVRFRADEVARSRSVATKERE